MVHAQRRTAAPHPDKVQPLSSAPSTTSSAAVLQQVLQQQQQTNSLLTRVACSLEQQQHTLSSIHRQVGGL